MGNFESLGIKYDNIPQTTLENCPENKHPNFTAVRPGFWHNLADSKPQHFISFVAALRCHPLLGSPHNFREKVAVGKPKRPKRNKS
jgi:hypothetical protein